MLRKFVLFLILILAALTVGWYVLQKEDIPYAALEERYALPDSQFMTLQDGLKVHFTDTGPQNGQAIVLVHGFSASLHTWEAWRTDLERDHRVLTLDLPGHGLTRADQPMQANTQRFVDVVHEVTQARGIERFVLAGSSMGGATAWRYALAHPDTVDGLVLVCAGGWPLSASEREQQPFIFKLLANSVARFLLRNIDMTPQFRSGLADTYSDPSFVTEALVDRYTSLARAPGHRPTLLALMVRERAFATAEKLAQITVPTLVMWGRDDNLVPVSAAHKFHDAIQGSRLVIYDDVGHLPHEEHASQSVADLRAFLEQIERHRAR